ncbi:MFS general substrate transporter [Aspergillus heteromorphus CBS 117.55]|uniref:MFS general substrate transporter n=1 Tax=Aspergillus heteromorphus CBS 117.55 TaxID=1448321 RepID=A0A317W9B8_9EURO|nr:MFS general substrate transporter [Aspergillus heteromorphus CBS 117.55]PWY81907.1 MFS general substrate transporter [Aspergillus heteromorphus CBS 117.55]
MGIGYYISAAPQLRLFESIICQQYYRDSQPTPSSAAAAAAAAVAAGMDISIGIPEDLCKKAPVQSALAQLVGWQSFFDNIPGLLLALPYGLLADKYGRRWVMTMSFVGQLGGVLWIVGVCWLGLPIRAMWLSSLFLVVGGGPNVAASVSMMVITDSTPEIKRSQIFMYFNAAVVIAEIISPPIGSLLMKQSLWLPILLNVICGAISIFLSWYMPETNSYAVRGRERGGYTAIPSSPGNDTSSNNSNEEPSKHPGYITGLLHTLQDSMRVIFTQKNIALLVVSFLISTFARDSMAFLLQYISTRYSWPIAKTSWLLSFRAAAQLLQFTLILPWVDRTMRKRFKGDPRQKDLYLARASIIAIAVGFAIMGVAPIVGLTMFGITINTAGSGFATFARSLLSSLIDPTMMGALYSTLALMDTLGSLLAGPMMAWAFRWGMQLGGVWLGMPYLVSAVLCGGMAGLVFWIRLGRGGRRGCGVDLY